MVFNASPERATVPVVGDGWSLHPLQARGADPVVRRSSVADGAVTVPGRITAVFVRR